MFIEALIGTASRVKILRTLSEVTVGFTIKELEKETGLSRGIIHKDVKRLTKSSVLVEIKAKGKLKAYRINVNHPYYGGLVSLFGQEKLFGRKNVVILSVWNMLGALTSDIIEGDKKSNIAAIKLFGSHARGTAAITSDVDLLVVLNEKNPAKETEVLETCERHGKKINAKINTVFMTTDGYKEGLAKKTALTDQINRGGIDLYYDLEKIIGDSNGRS